MIAHSEPTPGLGPSAHDRFKSRSRHRSLWSFGFAFLMHLLVLALWRPIWSPPSDRTQSSEGELEALQLVRIEVRAQPEISRPAPPTTSAPDSYRPTRSLSPPPTIPEGDLVRVVDEHLAVTDAPSDIPVVVPPLPAPAQPVVDQELARFRHLTPLMQQPELVNRAQVRRALLREYPRELQRRGVEGTVLVWFWIDEKGRVEKYEIRGSSGYPALDAAAERVIPVMEFRPAKQRGRSIPVIVTLPVRFEVE